MSYRSGIIERLKSVRPDLDLRTGSPLYIFLVDALATVTGPFEDEVAALQETSPDTIAANWLVTRDQGEDSVFTVRMMFYNPVSINFPRGGMIFKTDESETFSNQSDINISASSMQLYVDGTYYYLDINITGFGTYRSSMTFTWDNDPTDELAFIAIRSVVTGGALPETNDQLLSRVAKTSTLRSAVTRPGAVALLEDVYGATLREAVSVGFLDPQMNRDIIEDIHVGGCMDIYAKGDLPAINQSKIEVEILDNREVSDAITVLFLDISSTSETLPFTSITEYEVTSWVRPTSITFTPGTHYTLDPLTGTITMAPPPTPASTDYIQRNTFTGAAPTGAQEITIPGNISTRCYPGFVLQFDGDSELWMVQSVTVVGADTVLELDHNVGVPVSTDVYLYEPVRITCKYNPTAVELAELEKPVVRMDSMYVVDPMTMEETTLDVPRLQGYGAGIYGGGPYGYGSEAGWRLMVDDPNLRFSMFETGFFEIPRDFLGEIISLNYAVASNIAQFHQTIVDGRALAASQIVKAFQPVNTYFDMDVESEDPVTGMEQYLWGIQNEIDISDIINELYGQGVTEVDINDLMEDTVFELWDNTGIFVRLSPTPEGRLTLADNTMRIYPATMEIRLK